MSHSEAQLFFSDEMSMIMGSAPQDCCENSMRTYMSELYTGTGTEVEHRGWAFCSLCPWCLAESLHTGGIQLPLVKEEE